MQLNTVVLIVSYVLFFVVLYYFSKNRKVLGDKNEKEKILILCQYFYPEYVSSATLPTQMAEDLVERGMKIDVICGWPNEYSKERKVQNR